MLKNFKKEIRYVMYICWQNSRSAVYLNKHPASFPMKSKENNTNLR